jgi:hypothetical protein
MYRCALAGLVAAVGLVSPNLAAAEQFRATFSGFEEVPAVLSNGTASLFLNLNKLAQTLDFTLTYSGLSTPAQVAHIHFGKRFTSAPVIVFFCGGGGKPPCPPGGGTVMGKITPPDVVGPAAQGIAPGDFSGLVAALVSDTAYANIHTTLHPGGEIRGQIKPCEDDNCLYNLPAMGSQGNQP